MAQAFIRRRKNTFPYTFVDYIKFDGTANSALTLDIALSSDHTVSVTFDYALTASQKPVYATTSGTAGNYSHLMYQTNGGYETSTGSNKTTFDKPKNGKHTFISNQNQKNYFDGEVVTNYSPTTKTYKYTIGFGWSNVYYAGKIYEFRITSISTGDDVIWLVPVSYNDSGTTKYGFYDKVSKTLITKLGWTGGNDPVEIVTWASGTPAQIAAMLQAHDDGLINIYNYWNVGDERTEHLNAITADPTEAFRYDIAAQDVVMVLMNEGYESQNGIHYVVGQKDCLAVYDATDDAAIKYTKNNQYVTWGNTSVRNDIQNLYYNAFANTNFKALFKNFTTTFSNKNGTDLLTSTDKFALFAEKEIFGVAATNSYAIEQTALTQIEYYKTAANRIKLNAAWTQGTGGYWWYTRSLGTGLSQVVCVQSDGASGTKSCVGQYPSIAPFGCI